MQIELPGRRGLPDHGGMGRLPHASSNCGSIGVGGRLDRFIAHFVSPQERSR